MIGGQATADMFLGLARSEFDITSTIGTIRVADSEHTVAIVASRLAYVTVLTIAVRANKGCQLHQASHGSFKGLRSLRAGLERKA